MDYKKLISSQKLRIYILNFLCFIPDRFMVSIQYRIKFNRRLDLKNPRRFTEKIQWYKLYYRDPLMGQCADKALVRNYVEKCGCGHTLIPLIGVYESMQEIDFDKLPQKFVAKDTLGGGGNSVFICGDKSRMIENSGRGIDPVMKLMESWINRKAGYKAGGREWVYGGKRHRIIIEEYLESCPEEGGLIDYKFFCFYGIPQILYVIADRKVGERAGLGIYSAKDYTRLPVNRCDEEPLMRDIEKPEKYEEMLCIAGKLSKPFPEARIDLYFVKGKIYFGEITFFDGSGYMSFEPDQFDFQLGGLFVLPKKNI